MDQNVNNRHKEILWDLLANPAENGRSYKQSLEQLVQDNPQSGLLQVLYARTAETPDIKTASAYFGPKALHKIINDPDGLLPVSRERINKSLNGSHPAEPENYFNIGTTEIEAEDPSKLSDAPVAEEESLIPQEFTQPVDNIAPVEALPGHEQEAALPPHEEKEENYTVPQAEETSGAYTPTPEVEEKQPQPEPEIPAEEPTGPVDEIAEHQPVTEEPAGTTPAAEEPQPQPAYQYTPEAIADDEDATYTNPWDFSQLEEPAPEIAVADHNEEEQPQLEAAPEPTAETAPVVEEPKIDTYDHSLSAFEQAVVNTAEEKPEEEEKTEVSSFADYRTENVFHKQDYIDDEVFDEIVSIDEIGVEGLHNTFAEDTLANDEEYNDSSSTGNTPAEDQPDLYAETEKLIYGNIAATDYLYFDKKLDELRNGMPSAQPAPEKPAPVEQQPEPAAEIAAPIAQAATPGTGMQTQAATAEAPKEQDVVSKYDDDTMPYSFMWWLDKTRKEHAKPYQPYATANTQQPAAQATQANAGDQQKAAGSDDLQQQYYANIFSLTSVSSIGEIEPPQIEFDHSKKEDVIIERFIHTDPQIKPLSADKLDNENKAKRSSEDQDIMVTETLARIYTDQMLYHKAIATYKKLMLKIPEKKLYFASQIEQLEKKIN